MATSSVIPQENSKGEIIDQNYNQSQENSSRNNVTSPGIVNIFKTSITPPNINISTPDIAEAKNERMSGLGFIPLVWYNAYQIDAEDIQYLSLYDDGSAPAMKLGFVDTMGIMKDRAFPLDDTKITLFLNSRSDQLKPIFMQFKIRNFSNNNGIMGIDSTMDVDKLYVKKFKSYKDMTSNAVLQEVCKDLGLGFNTNITDTNDKMTWINPGQKPYDFIQDIINYAYISDESFIVGYIDHYYNFCFVDVQKELLRNIENELGVITMGLEEMLGVADKGQIGNLVLSNDASLQGSSMYFHSFKIINNSTATSIEYGYTDVIKYYDASDKSLLKFNVESLNANADKSIILKGAPQDETFYKSNVNYVYGGKLDSDNTHKNFNYSTIHNSRNILEVQKIGMDIELSTPNYNLYRFQKIKIILSSNTPTPASPMINQRLSGDWLIVDIKYVFQEGALLQVISLVKRELELSDEELDKELISTKREAGKGYDNNSRGSFENPTVNQSVTPSTKECTKESSMMIMSAKSQPGISALKKAASEVGLTTKYSVASLLAISGGESAWIPQVEGHIYSEDRLRKIFPNLSNDQVNRASRSGITKKEFFQIVYGEYDPKRIGNRNVSDGGLYYGRGYIQLTGYENYVRYAKLSGIDIVNNPDLVNDVVKGAKIAALYFKDRVNANQNDSSYFEKALKAVGKNVSDIHKKKTDYYNCLLGQV